MGEFAVKSCNLSLIYGEIAAFHREFTHNILWYFPVLVEDFFINDVLSKIVLSLSQLVCLHMAYCKHDESCL